MEAQQIKLRIPKSVLEALQDLADKRGDSLEDTLRHAVNTETYMNAQLEKGNKIIIKDKHGEVWNVVFTHIQ